jgi:hypothetical protein
VIGLTFLAIGLLWLAFSIFVGRKLPRWIGIRNPAGQWAVTVAVVAVLLVGPFVDHIVGMRQFERLCDEEMNLRISPQAASINRVRHMMGKEIELPGYAIRIMRSEISYINRDNDTVVASYNYFSTPGGRVGGLLRLGSPYTCFSTPSERRSRLDALTPIRQRITTD